MANTVIALKKSAIPSSVPSNLANGELAINYADGKLYYKAANGTISSISGNEPNYFGTVNAAGTFIIADTPGDILTLVAGSNITISGDALNDTITISATGGGNGGGASVVTDNVAPVSPSDGDLWWNTDLGKMLIYYEDSNSSQWVESTPGYLISENTISFFVAFNTANAAYAQANTARDHANAAYNKANTAVTDFSPAYNAANAAYAQANTARDHANVSFGQANTARTHANAAHLTANAAFDKANTYGIQGGGSDRIFWENDSVVTANYSITAGRNAGTFGPITINANVVVTIPSNSTWSVV